MVFHVLSSTLLNGSIYCLFVWFQIIRRSLGPRCAHTGPSCAFFFFMVVVRFGSVRFGSVRFGSVRFVECVTRYVLHDMCYTMCAFLCVRVAWVGTCGACITQCVMCTWCGTCGATWVGSWCVLHNVRVTQCVSVIIYYH